MTLETLRTKQADRREKTKGKILNAKKHKHEKPCECSGNSVTRSKGELVITVTRTSFNLPFDLPYCIWGALYVNTNFGVVLQPYLPAGITVRTGTDDNIISFIYTDGILTDVIQVTIPSAGIINYLAILSSLNTNYMRTEFMLFDCNAANDGTIITDQQIKKSQSNPLYLQTVSGGGMKEAQVIIPSSRTNINNSVKQIIEVYLRNEPVKPETVWIHNFAYLLLMGSLQYSFTVFISERVNMNSEKVEFTT